jgi:hexosaminidase
VSDLADLVYLPWPREIAPAAGAFVPRAGLGIVLAGEAEPLLPEALRVQGYVRRMAGMEWTIGAGAAASVSGCLLRIDPAVRSPQGYRLSISDQGIEISGADLPGLHYGVTTLAQIWSQAAGPLPAGRIIDRPDFPIRGVMIDISRDKVPSMDTLYGLVDLLSDLKVNHLELYMEHTFAYAAHQAVWANASPVTGEEILLLQAYCRDRFVDLVPNQNSFGHMHRWLSHPRYAHLAECPDGFAWPWGGRSAEPFSLDPSHPGSLALLRELYEELLPHFASSLFNVGCDETFDLGQGKNRELCAKKGKGRVYLEFLLAIHGLVKRHGRTMLYWGDIIMEHPELVPELPGDAIALEWGYEADHPFDDHGARFRDAGVPWWVCAGTSSWNSLAGRTDNCLANLRAAARAGCAHGATGFLNTDWGDNGHWQVLPVSWLGFAAGAGLSWCLASNGESDFSRELDAHVFRDRAGIMGGLARDLGNAYQKTGVTPHNASALFRVLLDAERKLPAGGIAPGRITETRQWIDAAAGRLDESRMDRPDAGLVRDEYANTVRLLRYACDHAAALADGTWGASTAPLLRDRLQAFIGEYRRIWMARNRIGGLSDSARRLEAILPSR